MKTGRRISTEYQPFPDEEGRNARQSQFEVPALVQALGLPSEARVLEVGCGRGIALPVIAELCRPQRLVGLDIDTRLLTKAADELHLAGAAAELICGDVREMPFEDDSFDVVIDFGTLFHIARAEDAAAEIARVLAPGGLFVEETKLSQVLSHPVRSRGRRLPSLRGQGLRRRRSAVLWSSRSQAA
jgi:ubiquinone/menaquinone biosynthesis C-methylase UbiE